jgi:hypothetical protein
MIPCGVISGQCSKVDPIAIFRGENFILDDCPMYRYIGSAIRLQDSFIFKFRLSCLSFRFSFRFFNGGLALFFSFNSFLSMFSIVTVRGAKLTMIHPEYVTSFNTIVTSFTVWQQTAIQAYWLLFICSGSRSNCYC